MEMIINIYKCDICGEESRKDKKHNVRQVKMKRYNGFFGLWEPDDYMICEDCFENMVKYCKEHKGG